MMTFHCIDTLLQQPERFRLWLLACRAQGAASASVGMTLHHYYCPVSRWLADETGFIVELSAVNYRNPMRVTTTPLWVYLFIMRLDGWDEIPPGSLHPFPRTREVLAAEALAILDYVEETIAKRMLPAPKRQESQESIPAWLEEILERDWQMQGVLLPGVGEVRELAEVGA